MISRCNISTRRDIGARIAAGNRSVGIERGGNYEGEESLAQWTKNLSTTRSGQDRPRGGRQMQALPRAQNDPVRLAERFGGI